jgi:hypothetical protein
VRQGLTGLNRQHLAPYDRPAHPHPPPALTCMSDQATPGFIARMTDWWASSTAQYTARWSGVNFPLAGKVVVMSGEGGFGEG